MRKRYVLDAGILTLYFVGHMDIKKFIDEIYGGELRLLCVRST